MKNSELLVSIETGKSGGPGPASCAMDTLAITFSMIKGNTATQWRQVGQPLVRHGYHDRVPFLGSSRAR
ncbi:MAG: hypothetical protein ACRDSL_03975 [Pseudonocardiaceae bacterium]